MKKSSEILATIGPARGRELRAGPPTRRPAMRGRQARVEDRRGGVEHAEERERRRASHRRSRGPSAASKSVGSAASKPAARRSPRSSSTLYQAKTRVRSASVGGGGKQRLLEDRDRAAVAAVHVEHADERRGGEQRRRRRWTGAPTPPSAGSTQSATSSVRCANARAEDERDAARRAPRPTARSTAPTPICVGGEAEARGVEARCSTAIRPMARARRNAAA